MDESEAQVYMDMIRNLGKAKLYAAMANKAAETAMIRAELYRRERQEAKH